MRRLMMFDPRGVESDRIRMSAAKAGLKVRYIELPEAVYHYSIVREYRNDSILLAQRLTAGEALAFLAGYRLGHDSRSRKRDVV